MGGGAYIVNKKIYAGSIYYSPFQLVRFYDIGNEYNYDAITEYEVDMNLIDTSLTVYLKPRWEINDERKFNFVDNVLLIWVPVHDIEASPEIPILKVIVNGEIVNDYNGISMDYEWRYPYFYNDSDVKLTIDPDLVEDDHIVLQFLVHGDD